MSLKNDIALLEDDIKKSQRALRYWGSEEQFKKFKERVEKKIQEEQEILPRYLLRLEKLEQRIRDYDYAD